MKYLPEPESVQVRDLSRYSGNTHQLMVTPYNNLDWKECVEQYGVKVPEIVDRTMGISTCFECKAKYSGNQLICGRKVIFHKPPGSYYDKRGYNPNFDNVEKECDGSLKWDLQSRFDSQVRFFNLLETIRFLPDPSYGPLVEFEKSFPTGVIPDLKVRLLAYQMDQFKMEVGNALNQIATKMNNAGHSLSF